MKISNSKTIRELQEEFQEYFPYLKIEFYKEEPGEALPGEPKKPLNTELKLSEIRTDSIEGYLSIDRDSTIGDFEKLLKKVYGLNIQVFRQSGNLWLQTSTTDHWTMSEANRKGEHSVLEYNKKYSE